jgi:hypothetical protein
MSDFIYHYWKENPEHPVDKFSIVGGFAGDNNLRQHIGKIGGYYGSGEYEIDISELDNLVFKDSNKISVIGADEVSQVSASTLEPSLRDLFDSMDLSPPKYKKYDDADYDQYAGGDDDSFDLQSQLKLNPAPPRDTDKPAIRLCDVSDEMLYSCPDMTGGDESILDDNNENRIESDYHLAEHINNDIDDSDDNIEIPSEEEVAAMESLVIGGEDYDSDIDIMQYLN